MVIWVVADFFKIKIIPVFYIGYFFFSKNVNSVGIFIGPEGGFENSEIEKALEMGAKVISLGKRILRTETAAVTAVSMCMLQIEMQEENNQ